MNKVVNGRRYDTSTALFFGSAKVKINRIPATLSLYRKRGGEYFIASADGDPEYLKHVSPRQAKKWAYTHLPIDDYEAHFGTHLQEDTTKQTQMFSLKRGTIEKLRIAAAKQNTTMSDIVDQLATLLITTGGVNDGEEETE